MNSKLFIPSLIKIGYQKRTDTYTGQLGYVIYNDGKVWRKETSWDSWRDKKIEPNEFDNSPTEGFVLNRDGGGGRGWDARNAFIRIFDPRGFEFEIDPSNLLYILQHCDCTRGKGLESKFVYAWQGTSLILLPENAPEYKASLEHTALQDLKVSLKDLKEGNIWRTKNNDTVTYLGRRFWFYNPNNEWRKSSIVDKTFHIFYNNEFKDFIAVDSAKALAQKVSELDPSYPDLVDKFTNSRYASKPVELFLKDKSVQKFSADYEKDRWAIGYQNGYLQCNYNNHYKYISAEYLITLNNNILESKSIGKTIYKDGKKTNYNYYWDSIKDLIPLFDEYMEPTNTNLWVRLESGAEFRVNGSSY